MHDILLITAIDLRLFDGAGGGGAAAAAGASAGGDNAGAPAQANAGQQPAATPAANGQQQAGAETEDAAARRKRYNDAIKGEWKDLFAEDVQRIIDRRFKAAKEAENELSRSKAVLSTLMERYGVADLDALSRAVDEDDAYWDAYGEALGKTGREARADVRYRVEQKARMQAEQARQSELRVRSALERWDAEGAELAKEPGFEGFNFRDEARINPTLIDLLNAGIPMRQAYGAIHMDDMLAKAAAEAEQRMTANVRAKGQRPAENGFGGYGGVSTGKDVHQLTREERRDLVRRAAKGERITL